MSQFSLATLQDGKDQKYSLKTADCTFSSLNPPHSWQGAMYWPSGTLRTPIASEPPNNNIYPKISLFSLATFQEGKDH